MRVLVCGDRNWRDVARIRKVMEDHLAELDEVIHGGASGADQISGGVARSLGVPVRVFWAKWGQFGVTGKGDPAGPIRNREMLNIGKPDRVWAFHDFLQGSLGTKDMVGAALAHGLPVTLYGAKTREDLTMETFVRKYRPAPVQRGRP